MNEWMNVSHVTWWNYQIWTQSSSLRRSYCDLCLTLWPWTLLRVALGCGIIFTKFHLRQLIRAWIIAFFDADTSCHAVTLTFLSEIEQSVAEYTGWIMKILRFFACSHAMTLTFDQWRRKHFKSEGHKFRHKAPENFFYCASPNFSWCLPWQSKMQGTVTRSGTELGQSWPTVRGQSDLWLFSHAVSKVT